MLSSASGQDFTPAKATVVRPTSLQSFRDHTSPAQDLTSDYGGETDSPNPSIVGDRFQNNFKNIRNLFETRQRKQDSLQTPKSPVSGSTSPPMSTSSPVIERIESFSTLKKRYESDANNNTVARDAPRATRHCSCNVGTLRESWASSSSPSNSRRSSASSTELNDKSRRSSEMAIVRDKIAIAKHELAGANERREVAERGYAEAKRRIQSSKRKSKSLRDQVRSIEDMVERKEKKIKELSRRLGARTIMIEQNRRAAEYYDKDIRNESEWIDKVTEKIEAERKKKKETAERIRDIAQRISPIKAAIADAEARTEKARHKARRLEAVLTKTSIRLKNARALSADAAKRTSFQGFRVEDVQQKIIEQRERGRRAQSDISYLEYRKELLCDQLLECKEEVRQILMRLKPQRQQRALGFIYTRIPMSEEL